MLVWYDGGMARKTSFANGEKYHIYNRGTEKRKIFLDDKDYERFLFILNTFNHASGNYDTNDRMRDFRKGVSRPKEKEPLVRIEKYCLMPNHYHLILEQVADNGISKFLQKVMTGFTMYFNVRYDRTGVLFQGKTKSKHVGSGTYYNQVRTYIDLNPVELIDKDWKKRGKVSYPEKVAQFLAGYKWSDCKDYVKYGPYLTGKSELLSFDDLFG